MAGRSRPPLRATYGLALASHPGPTAAVTAIMTALAVTAGRGASTAWVALAVLAGQLSVGWSNDYLDRHRDRSAVRSAKPVAAGGLSPTLVGTAALVALAAAVAFSFASGWRAALAHIAGIAAAWAYNLGLKGTAASVLPYAVAFGLLPAFITLGLAGHPWPAWWAVAAGGLLGTAAHFTNVLPDIPDDVDAGVRGLPHRLGATRSRLVSAGALLAASVLLIAAPAPADSPVRVGTAGILGLVAVAVAGIVMVALPLRNEPATAGRPEQTERTGRTVFVVTVLVALADVALFIARGASIH